MHQHLVLRKRSQSNIVFCTESTHPSSLEEKLCRGNPGDLITFLAALYENEVHYCSGALISPIHVLTAAQCLEGFFNCAYPIFENYYAVIASLYLNEEGIQFYFEQVEVHQDYNFENDKLIDDNIGLITVLIKTYNSILCA